MSLAFITLDVFTTTKFHGNPLALVLVPPDLSATLTQAQKQLIAREFNLSETVFLHEPPDNQTPPPDDVRVDIFTSFTEIPFAGHPTIGTANHILRHLHQDPRYSGIRALQIKAGRTPIQLSSDSSGGAQLKVAHDVHVHDSPFRETQFAQYPVVSIVKGMTFILARCDGLEELAKPTENLVGTAKTLRSNEALDEGWRTGLVLSYFFVDLGVEDGVQRLRTRMFGSREDPATGSAASALCAYLTLTSAGDSAAATPATGVEKGEVRKKYHITQGVEMGRRSDIFVEVALQEGGREVKEVVLSGTAVKVMEGRVDIPAA